MRILINRQTDKPINRLNSKGAVFIIVLALLSILVLIAATLSYSSRMEVISAANFSEGMEARQLALSGLQTAIKLLEQPHVYTAYNQAWSDLRRELAPESATGSEQDVNDQASFNLSLASLKIYDQSAKININTAEERQLAQALSHILKDHGFSAAKGESLARVIAKYRLGPDGKPGKANFDDDLDNSETSVVSGPLAANIETQLYLQAIAVNADGIDNDQDGEIDEPLEGVDLDGLDNDNDGQIDEADEGVDEPDEYQPDLRLPRRGDDRCFTSLEELRILPGFQDEQVFNALGPYLTVFSSCRELYPVGEELVAKINLNFSSPQIIYENLKRYLPDKDDTLLKQFAVNMVDFRDRDSVPTVFPQEEQTNPILGIENTPYINEVWPDSLTDDEDGDDGQYIELFNPYEQEISVDGWRLTVGGSTVYLTGSIARQGFLIITDDYNNENDPEPEDEFANYGSLYDIFKVVPNNFDRRLIENFSLNIPNNNGIVYLRDSEGQLIDYFSYEGGTYTGVHRSFQRNDPRVRLTEMTNCTPLALNSNYTPAEEELDKVKPGVANRLFSSPAELMLISAGFAHNTGTEGWGWVSPSIALSAEEYRLDSRIIDIFTIIKNVPLQSTLSGDEDIPDNLKLRFSQLLRRLNEPSTLGRININTASYYALLAVPDMTDSMAKAIIKCRAKGTGSEQGIPFRTISELLRCPNLWQNVAQEDRLGLFDRWMNYITVNSSSFWCVSKGIVGEKRRMQRQVALEALLGLEGGDQRLVYFHFLN